YTTGDVWEASFMLNLLYDIPLSSDFWVSLGAGAGGDFAKLTLGPESDSADDWNLAYQGIAGLNFAIGRQTALTLNYRYFRVHDPGFYFLALKGIVLNGDDFVKHTVTIGLRYALESPSSYVEVESASSPPPPPPEATSAPPQQFIVFFGFNKYNLTSEALR